MKKNTNIITINNLCLVKNIRKSKTVNHDIKINNVSEEKRQRIKNT